MAKDSITIQGLSFSVPNRYEAGHTLTENEAGALNQVFHENLRNNFASTVKKARTVNNEDGTTSEIQLTDEQISDLQAQLDKYAETYEFGARAVAAPRAPKDPVEAEAFNLAKQAVRKAAAAKNISLDAAQVAELAQKALQTKGDQFREVARARVQAAQALASLDLDSVEGGEEPAPKKGRKAA